MIVKKIAEGNTDFYVSDDVWELIMSIKETGIDGSVSYPLLNKFRELSAVDSFIKTRSFKAYRDEFTGITRMKWKNYRVIGFQWDGDFIGLAHFKKNVQSLSRVQKGIVEKVFRIKRDHHWRFENET